MNPQANARYRAEYRQQEIGRHYSGWAHFAFTAGSTSAVILACAMALQDVHWWEWAAVPVFAVLANLIEHFGHRHPMHRPVRGLGLVFRRHAGQHHRFFTHEHMTIDSSRDLKALLFPPVLFAFFFGVFALPLGLALAVAATPNLAYLFVLTSVGYFLNYELLHFAYHLPQTSWVYRIPGLRALRRHHLAHHNPALMTHYNFNITYPIGDWLWKTWYRPGRETVPGATAPAGQAQP